MAKINFSSDKITVEAAVQLDISLLHGLTVDGACEQIRTWQSENHHLSETTFRYEHYYDDVTLSLVGNRLETDEEFAVRQKKIQKIEHQKAARVSREELEREKKILKLRQDAEALGFTIQKV